MLKWLLLQYVNVRIKLGSRLLAFLTSAVKHVLLKYETPYILALQIFLSTFIDN